MRDDPPTEQLLKDLEQYERPSSKASIPNQRPQSKEA